MLKPISVLGGFLAAFLIKRVIQGKKDYKPEFQQSQEIVWLFYVMLMFLFNNLLFPYMTLALPVLNLYIFYLYYFWIRYLSKKKVS